MSDLGSITYADAAAVTPSDTTDDPAGPFAGFYTAGGGDIKVKTVKGNTVTLHGTAAGIVIPLDILRVFLTSPAPPANVVGMIGRGQSGVLASGGAGIPGT